VSFVIIGRERMCETVSVREREKSCMCQNVIKVHYVKENVFKIHYTIDNVFEIDYM